MNRFRFQIVLLALFIGCFRLFATVSTGLTVSDNIFNSPELLRISIEIPASGIDKLRMGRWPHTQKVRTKVHATIIEGTHTYTNVLVQQKGAGTFRGIDDFTSLTLHFSKEAPKQEFHGLKKISLNNSIQDPTCLHEKLSRELFAAAGVPVPRADQAVVTLNGRKLGVYVLLEGYDKRFLARYFKRTDGNLYDGGFLRDIDQPLEVDSRGNSSDRSDLDRLIAAAMESDPTRRFQALNRTLDVDRFTRMTAMETILCHWDSYSINRSNYRVFYDATNGKMVFMPHGMDRVLGGFLPNIDLSIVPPMRGLAARALISTPEGRRRHVEMAGVLFTNFFDPEKLCARVHQMDEKIAAEMLLPNPRWSVHPQNPELEVATLGNHHDDVENLCARIRARAKYLKAEFENRANTGPGPLLVFDSRGMAKVEGWKFKTFEKYPMIRSEDISEKETNIIHLAIPEGAFTGSLRSRVTVPEGEYRFEIKMRASSLLPLRLSSSTIPFVIPHYSGNRFGNEYRFLDFQWQTVTYNFEVSRGPSPAEIELICDIKHGPGSIWFDADSSRLIRKPIPNLQ